MARARTALIAAALLAAFTLPGSLVHAQEEHNGNVTMATVLDASLRNAPVLADWANGGSQLQDNLANRELRIIDVDPLVNPTEAATFDDLLKSSDVLSQNTLLVRDVAANYQPLRQVLDENGIAPDRVVAVDVMSSPTAPASVYVFTPR